MPQNTCKETIYNFLKENKGKRFSCKDISRILKISYITVLKWVDVLIGENKIKVLNYGNLKQVWFEEEEIKEGSNG